MGSARTLSRTPMPLVYKVVTLVCLRGCNRLTSGVVLPQVAAALKKVGSEIKAGGAYTGIGIVTMLGFDDVTKFMKVGCLHSSIFSSFYHDINCTTAMTLSCNLTVKKKLVKQSSPLYPCHHPYPLSCINRVLINLIIALYFLIDWGNSKIKFGTRSLQCCIFVSQLSPYVEVNSHI